MNRIFFLLALCSLSLLSCGPKPTEEVIVNRDLLWEILMKIPEKHTPYGFLTTQAQRLEAKETGMYTPYGDDDMDQNFLHFEDLSEGVYASLIYFPSEDGKKLIIIYHQNETVFYSQRTVADYTYEYDLANGKLTPIERPMDPLSLNEFFDLSAFTPKQLRAVQYAFQNKTYHTLYYSEYSEKDCIEISLQLDACFGEEAFDSEEAYNECRSIMWEQRREAGGKRYWDGQRFVRHAQVEEEISPVSRNIETTAIENPVTAEEGSLQKTDEIINRDLLWKIFMKLPEDVASEYYIGLAQRQKQRESRYKIPPYVNHKNYILLPEEEMGTILACYPTEDNKKLLTIFHQEHGIDGANTVTEDRCFEYEPATGKLTVVERPMDPYTLDEFIDTSLLNPTQLRLLRYSFQLGNRFILDFTSSKQGFGVYLMPDGGSDETLWGEKDHCRDLLNEYGYDVKRYWNGKRFVKSTAVID